MTAKEYLNQYRALNKYIDCKLEQISQLEAFATRLSPTAMFDRSGNISDRVGSNVAKIVDLERKIDSDIDELVKLRDEISCTISQISDVNIRILLEMRYLSGYSWEKIASKMHYAEKYVTGVLHRRALNEVQKMLPNVT